MAAFIPPMIAGEVFFMSGYSPRDVAHLIHRRRISVLVCVPQMLELLRDYILQAVPEANAPARNGKWYWKWWQYRRVHRRFGWKFWSFVVGAAPLDPALEEFWGKLGYVVIQGYGLTETAPVATLNHPFDSRKGTVGKAIAGVEIRIAPDGEVLLRGENITPGYFGEGSIRDPEGWLHTGDIGELDRRKRLKILGRKKEMIVSPDGLNVFPEDVERVLNAIKGVRESAVVARQAGRARAGARGSRAGAGCQRRGHRRRSEPAARAPPAHSQFLHLAAARAAPHFRHEQAEARGNRQAGVARQTTAERPAHGRHPESSRAAVRWTRTRSLDDLALSSLDRIQLMMELEQRTGAAIDESQFAGARTIGDLTRVTAAPSTEDFRIPGVEPRQACAMAAAHRAARPDPAAGAHLRVDQSRRTRKPARSRTAGHLRVQPPEPFRCARDILRRCPRSGDTASRPPWRKNFSTLTFIPRRYPLHKRFTNGLNYFSGVAGLQRFPAAAARSGRARSAALRGQPRGGRQLHSHLPGRQAHRCGRNPSLPAGRRHAGVAAASSCRSRTPGRTRTRAAQIREVSRRPAARSVKFGPRAPARRRRLRRAGEDRFRKPSAR